jgi:hypothetical protein
MIEQFQLAPAPWHHPELPRGRRARAAGAGVPARLSGSRLCLGRLLDHFAKAENGGYRCVAPNLRGFERSSAPADVGAYRPSTWCRTSRR